MKNVRNKTTIAAMLLVMSMVVSMMSISSVTALIPTVCSVSASPKVQQVGKNVLVNAWITPQAPFTAPPDVPGYSVYANFYINITQPDGNIYTYGPAQTESSASIYFYYTPTLIGDYSAVSYWNGDANHTGNTSPPIEFTVQQDPIPQFQDYPLPTGFWDRPISAELRAWSNIGGYWCNTGRNEGDEDGSCANPYSTAPGTAHVLWKLNTGLGGLITGEYGTLSTGRTPSKVLMHGNAYFSQSDGTHCVDLTSGEELWVAEGTGGSLFLVPGPTPYVWAVSGNNWVRLDPWDGRVTRTCVFNMEFRPQFSRARMVVDENGLFYFHTYNTRANAPVLSGQVGRAVCWDSNVAATASNWSAGVVWEVIFAERPEDRSLDHPWQVNGGLAVRDGLMWMNGNGGNTTTTINATSGKVLQNTITDIWLQGFGLLLDGTGIAPSGEDRRIHGFNAITGEEIWQSEQADYPYGAFWPYQTAALYGNFYEGNYDGNVRCINAKTGETVWKFYGGDTTETPYGTYPFYNNPAIADGKIFYPQNEHSPTQPIYRGQRIYCLDAFNGTEIWSFPGMGGQIAIADGALVASDQYSSNMFAFNKGQTTTAVEVKSDVVTEGSSVIIQGTVVDNSPAQPGTPAISDESMTSWMEYLHCGRPMPIDITGVDVTINVLDSNNNFRPIGTVTADASGFYSLMWTPDIPGKFTVIANFEGSESYYSSYAETAFGVTEAPSPAQPLEPEPTTEAPFITTEIAIIAAVAVIAVIGIVAFWALRKRK